MQCSFFLTTHRLGFRYWHENDLDLAEALWGDNAVTRFIDARGQLSIDDVRKRLEMEIRNQNEYGMQYWPVFLIQSGQHVGCCGLRPYDRSKRIYEIGVHIRSDQWRKGYAREAAEAVIHHGFHQLGAAGLFAGHNPKNTASRYLLEKLGFRYTHDEYYPPTGLNHPSYLMEASDDNG